MVPYYWVVVTGSGSGVHRVLVHRRKAVRHVVVRTHGAHSGLAGHAGDSFLLTPRCARSHVRALELLDHLHLLLQQVVEQDDLFLEPHAHVVGHEEVRVLLLQLLPNEGREARLDASLVLQRENNVLPGHVLLQTPLNQVLDVLDVSATNFVLP
jgi:hypothetical protein